MSESNSDPVRYLITPESLTKNLSVSVVALAIDDKVTVDCNLVVPLTSRRKPSSEIEFKLKFPVE